MAFNDSFPAGRIPVMAPITFTDGWPSVSLVNGRWGGSYPFPDVTCRDVPPRPQADTFSGSALHPEWAWNHHADDSKWSVGDGLTLQTATVTDDLYAARNTLTRRIAGPASTATIELDYTAMANGDVAGLAAFRDTSAWIGVKKANFATRVVMTNGLTMAAGTWNTTGLGSEVADSTSPAARSGACRGRRPHRQRRWHGAIFLQHGRDGVHGSRKHVTLNKDWQYFMGYRFGIFNTQPKRSVAL